MRAALQSPIFDSVARWLGLLPAERFPSLDELNALVGPSVKSGAGVPIVFVQARPAREPYERLVCRAGRVPTREANWHDLFNALAWLSFPQTKAVLNRRHCEELERSGQRPGRRGTARDVLTLFDEGGVVVASRKAGLLQYLRSFEWNKLFWQHRAEVSEHMRFFVFGHAILEKSLQPYKALSAKALLLDVPASFISAPLDVQLAETDTLTATWFSAPEALNSTQALRPLPVLGVPGWADNGSAAFYEDPQVFRCGCRAQGKAGTVGSSP